VTTWEPHTYLQFAEVRFRAGLDLLQRIPPGEYRQIYDLGCGTGHLTKIVAERFLGGRVTGIDSSPSSYSSHGLRWIRLGGQIDLRAPRRLLSS
jgi:trans-aconitate 2-methyltransferase